MYIQLKAIELRSLSNLPISDVGIVGRWISNWSRATEPSFEISAWLTVGLFVIDTPETFIVVNMGHGRTTRGTSGADASFNSGWLRTNVAIGEGADGFKVSSIA